MWDYENYITDDEKKYTHTYTHPKKVSHSSVKELTGWQIRVRSFLPWRRILGKGPKLSIIISHPLLILSSIEYHLVFHDDQRPRRGEHQLGIKMFYTLIRTAAVGAAVESRTDEGSFKWHEILCVVWTLSWRFNGQRQQIEPIFNGVRTDDTKFVGVTLLSVFQ